jgi:L-lactate dehydrogenase
VIKRKGGTFYAVAPMIVELMRAIAFDQKRILPVSTLMEGPLGMSNVALSLPTIVGRGGRERVLEPSLDETESSALQNSYRVLREAVESVGL